jgi:type IV secretion system protein VirB10
MGFNDDAFPSSGGIFDAFDNQGDTNNLITEELEDEGADEESQEGFITNPFEDNSENATPNAEPLSEENGEIISLDTNQQTEKAQEPFTPSKAPASSVLGGGPHKLNKQLILYAGVGVLAVFIIVATFIAPLFEKKQITKTKKPDTATMNPVDYSALIPKRQREAALPNNEEEDEEIMLTLPPVSPEYQYIPPPQDSNEKVMAQGGSGSTRPDTRGDRLQSKNISGIKGITPTQSQYASGNASGAGASYQGPAAGAAPSNPYAQFGMPGREDYTAQMLSQFGQQVQGYSPANTYANQNDQSGKMNFYNQGRENAGGGVWLGPTTIWQGTMFEATLTSNINTDLPGEVTAVIAKNVYSSLDGQYLLIPQNSKLFGSYNSSIS